MRYLIQSSNFVLGSTEWIDVWFYSYCSKMSKFSFGFSFNREIKGFVKWAARHSNPTDKHTGRAETIHNPGMIHTSFNSHAEWITLISWTSQHSHGNKSRRTKTWPWRYKAKITFSIWHYIQIKFSLYTTSNKTQQMMSIHRTLSNKLSLWNN